MARPLGAPLRAAFVIALISAGLAGCASTPSSNVRRVSLNERECLARVMYFESNRSSDDGMIAVGTVVMNRLKSGRHGSTICEVVGARNQFAPGVLSKPMTDRGAPRAYRNADLVLAGRRHSGVQSAMFFHTAGYKFPYNNMRYVLVAGGNAFYDKQKPPKNLFGGEGRWPGPPAASDGRGDIMIARNEPTYRAAPVDRPIVVASVEPAYRAQPGYRDAAPRSVAAMDPSRREGRGNSDEMYAPPPPPEERVAVRQAPAVRPQPAPGYPAQTYEAPREDVVAVRETSRASRGDSGRIESAPIAPPAGLQAQPRQAPREQYASNEAPAPTRTARAEPARARSSSPEALGWHVGAQPAAGYDAAPPQTAGRYEAEARAAAEPDEPDVEAPRPGRQTRASRGDDFGGGYASPSAGFR